MQLRRIAAIALAAAVPAGLATPAVAATPGTVAACDASNVSVSVGDWSTEYNRSHVMYLVIDNRSDCAVTNWVIEWDRPANIIDDMAVNMSVKRTGQHFRLTPKTNAAAAARSKRKLDPVFGSYTGTYSQPTNLRITPQF